MIKIYLTNTTGHIVGEIDKELLLVLDRRLSYVIPGHQFSGRGNWDGRIRLLTKHGYFPIGMLQTITTLFNKVNVQYEIIDNRPEIKYGKEICLTERFKPRDYQEEVVKKAFAAGSGIIKSPTGSGKALMCAMIAGKYNTDTIIYVVTKDLLYQMYETVTSALGVECGIIGDGKCEIVKGINICTIWSAVSAFGEKFSISDSELDAASLDKGKQRKENIDKIKRLVRNANLIIVDECQYAASNTVQFLHKNSTSARHRFLLSGTPWRESGDDLLIEAVSGPKIFDLSASDLINKNILVRPEIHIIRNSKMTSPGSTYPEIYKNYIVQNDERNLKIKNCAEKLVASGKKTLILISKIEHGKILYDMLSEKLNVEYLSGANTAEERKQIIKELEDGRIDIIIASKIFEVGVDIPMLDALIIASGGKSRALAFQRVGRVIRSYPGKKSAIVIDFLDDCRYLREHSSVRIQTYKSEPEFRVKLPPKQR